MDASIFISFATEDRKVASTLCKALESRGFKCWISSRDIQPGENFQVAIVRAIRKAQVLLLVFTANSNKSQEMTKELALASQEQLIVVPLRVEDVKPSDAFAYEFATRQWIDFFADWEFAIDQLSERLTQALPAPVAAAATADTAAAPVVAPPPAKPAPAPKPAAAAPAPPPLSMDEIRVQRDAILPEKPIGESVEPGHETDPGKTGRRRGIWLALAAVIVVLIGVGLAAPALFGKKPTAADPAPAAAVPLPDSVEAPAAEPAVVDPLAAPADPLAVAEAAKPVVKPKRKAAPKKVEDIPY